MKITLEDLAPTRKLVRVEVDAPAVDQTFDKCTADYQKHGQVQGFRAGKAPKSLIVQNYGKDIEKSVKQELMSTGMKKAISDNKLEVIETLNVDEVQFGRSQPFEFTATVEVLPKFDLPQYTEVPVKLPVRSVTDGDVTKAIDILRQQKAEYKTVDRAAQDGDILVLSYTGTVEGKPITEFAPTAKGITEQKGFWLEIKPGSFIPGFVEQLRGVKAGEKKEVTVDFPKDFVTPEVAEKKGVYAVEVTEVKERVMPALDEAFAKTLGAESVEKLQEGVRKDLEVDLNRKKQEVLRGQIVDVLLKGIQFELPDSLVRQETRNEIYGIVQQNQKRGIPPSLIEEKKDEIFSHASNNAQSRLKLNIILTRIAAKENIQVTKQEFETQIAYMAYENQTPPLQYFRDLEKKGSLPALEERMLFEKTLRWLAEKAKIEETTETAPAQA